MWIAHNMRTGLVVALFASVGLMAACATEPRQTVAAHRVGAPTSASPTAKSANELFSAGRRPVVTGWELEPARLSAAYCADCHADRHAEWAPGMHAKAWSDPLFLKAFAREPRRWCENCHAPLVAQHDDAVLRKQGINCAACHVRDGTILGPRTRVAGDGAHTVCALPGFAEAALCEGCHQFNFPASFDGGVRYSTRPMQDTLREWRAAAAETCRSCHYRGHQLLGPHDTLWLEQLVRAAKIERVASDLLSLQIELAPRAHGLPTGDLFHSLTLELASDATFAHVLARTRYGREFGPGFISTFTISTRATLRDTTIPAQAKTLNVTFDDPGAVRLFARLRYFMYDPAVDHTSKPDPASATTLWAETYDLPPQH